jgi:transposase-like protein
MSHKEDKRVSGQIGGTEGVRRTTGVTPIRAHLDTPDPEVSEKKARRRFTAQYKLGIVEQADMLKESGQIGALLRREGLYSSNLTTWRRQRDEGQLQALSPKKRGRKARQKNPLAQRVARLEKENRRLQDQLKQAKTIIEVQKKISEILGIPQSDLDDNGSDS